MADTPSELRALRDRVAALADRADQWLAAGPGGAPRQLVRVIDRGAIPTANGHFFAVVPARAGGVEGEGRAAGVAAGSAPFYVAVYGSRVAAAGDYLVAHAVPSRWVALTDGKSCTVCYALVDRATGKALTRGTIRFGDPNNHVPDPLAPTLTLAPPADSVCHTFAPGDRVLTHGLSPLGNSPDATGPVYVQIVSRTSLGGGPCPGGPECVCDPLPTTIAMTVDHPAATNGILQSCTLVQGVVPPWAAVLSIPASAFLSTVSFTDDLAPYSPFYYALNCYLGFYAVTRIYQSSPWGSPFRDMFRYMWAPGLAGNTCEPFVMTRGLIYPGGDPSVRATLAGVPS